MSGWKKQSLVFLVTAALVLSLSAPSALAMDQVEDIDGTAGAMIFDLVVARPLGIVATVVGWTTFVVSLPFTALGGNVGEAAQKLVVAPAAYTFDRPLGRFETKNR